MLRDLIPSSRWLPAYKRVDLPGDLTAGVTVAVMLIPQGMAYAMLAGLPPIVGLYASILPLLTYALLGTSGQLAVGPVAMVSLMVASGVGALAEGGTERYLALALLLAGMVGVLQLAMGLFRLGFLVNLLSHPVISGFTSAAALIIGLSQLKHLMGVNIPRSHHVHEVLWNAVQQGGNTSVPTLVIGLVGVATLLALKKISKRLPGALVVVVLGTLAVWGLGLDARGVAIVGTVPGGLPGFSIPRFAWDDVRALLPTALAIGFVGFMESISVAKAFAARTGTEVDANQELVALGAANIVAFGFAGYPVTGGFSRSAINADAGARTPLASVFSALFIAITLLLLTPLFHDLPKAVLAAIVMVAVFGLIDVAELRHLWKVKKADALVLVATFVATLALGIELGIMLGVAASLIGFLRRTTAPHTAVLGQLPGTQTWRNLDRFPDALVPEDVAVLRVDAALYFANVAWLKDRAAAVLVGRPKVRTLILHCGPVNDVDSSAVHGLEQLHRDLSARQVRLVLANVKGPVRDILTRANYGALQPVETLGMDLHAAVCAATSSSVAPGRQAS